MLNVEGVAYLPFVTTQVFPESPAAIHITGYPEFSRRPHHVSPATQ